MDMGCTCGGAGAGEDRGLDDGMAMTGSALTFLAFGLAAVFSLFGKKVHGVSYAIVELAEIRSELTHLNPFLNLLCTLRRWAMRPVPVVFLRLAF